MTKLPASPPVDCFLLLACPEFIIRRARWVFRNWAARYQVRLIEVARAGDIPAGSICISYGSPQGETVPRTFSVPYNDKAWREQPDIVSARFHNTEKHTVVDPWGYAETVFRTENTGTTCGFDVAAAVYTFLNADTRATEHDLDVHGRIRYDRSLVGRLGLVHRPVVDEWMDLITTGVEKAAGTLPRRSLWGGHSFALCVTHDIDRVHRGWVDAVRKSRRELLHGRLRTGLKTAWGVKDVLKNRGDLYWNLQEVLNIDRTHGVKPTFFLMADGDHELDAPYSLRERRWRTIISNILDAGGEIALHGSYDSFNDSDMLTRQRRMIKKAIGCSVRGCRQHYLRYDPADTPSIHNQSGIKYDTTLGFAEHVGFRNGTAHPFVMYDTIENHPLPVVEIPLAIMDRTLDIYRKLNVDDAWNEVEPVLETVAETGGCVSVLWHNILFSDAVYPGWRDVFEQIIHWARQRNAYLCTCQEAHDITRSSHAAANT